MNCIASNADESITEAVEQIPAPRGERPRRVRRILINLENDCGMVHCNYCVRARRTNSSAPFYVHLDNMHAPTEALTDRHYPTIASEPLRPWVPTRSLPSEFLSWV